MRGSIVEVGAGTGADFPYFPSCVHVLAIEPNRSMMARAQARVLQSPATIDLCVADDSALEMLEPESVDAVVFPLVLCSIDEPLRALDRARRVLRPAGRLVVLEHVRGHGRIGRIQDALLPIWRRIGGGCRPNQDTRRLIEHSGFVTDKLQQRRISRFSPIQDLLIGYASLPKL
ncbi:MAG: class I SAM-dependent methyltransferase [Vulcanimicrobiaceae bacterium]